MATLCSVLGEIDLEFKYLSKEYDPFQVDLEWFQYEFSVSVRRIASAENEAPSEPRQLECSRIHGRINRKDFSVLLKELDAFLSEGQELRFEPYDLNFYLEWSRETEHVCLIIAWFDLALAPRGLEQPFPTAHTGFRFLAEDSSVRQFRNALAREFLGDAGPAPNSSLVN